MYTKLPVRRWKVGGSSDESDAIADEVAVALTYNRQSHVVMMATPSDLEDFALGFSLSEGIMRDPSELLAVRVLPREQGIEVAMTVSEDCQRRLAKQRRNLAGRTGCGLCGAESLEQAMRPPKTVGNTLVISHGGIQRAMEQLRQPLPLNQATGAVHCAAWCGTEGEVMLAREDVGRHNALDKLIGARAKEAPSPGFVAVSSRASYEMVYKAAAAGSELLVAVSAPTALAIRYALDAGLTLVGFARPGRHNVYTFPERITDHEDGPSDV